MCWFSGIAPQTEWWVSNAFTTSQVSQPKNAELLFSMFAYSGYMVVPLGSFLASPFTQRCRTALTIMWHAERQAFLKAAILALVPVLFLNLAAPFTFLVLQLHADCSTKEALWVSEQKDETDRRSKHVRWLNGVIGDSWNQKRLREKYIKREKGNSKIFALHSVKKLN